MLFSNPFFLVYFVLLVISVSWTYFMDGQPKPEITYNGNQALISATITVIFMAGAIAWAASH